MIFSLVFSTSCCGRFEFANVLWTSKLRNGKTRAAIRDQISLDVRSRTKCNISRVTAHPWLDSSWIGLGRKRMRHFVSGDRSCADLPRAGRPRSDQSDPLRKFLHDFPFVTARMTSRQFSAHPITIKAILRRDLRLKKCARRWSRIN
jgi:hypothetical protein